MKKLLLILVLGLLLSGNAYAENITILCIDEKRSKEESRDVHIIINFDEDGDWIEFGNQKYTNGTKSVDGENTTITKVKINRNEIRMSHNNLPTLRFFIVINRLDGAMYQRGEMANLDFEYNYKCEKDVRKF